MLSRIASVLFVLFLGICFVGAYRLVEAQVAADVYGARLAELARDYDQLRAQYDEAVRRTAVTELQVRDGALFVSIRTLAGERRTIPTPYDPSSEIYVDYVVVDGRLWIRRVFDAATPPEEALVIDSDLRQVDWEAEGALHGKAAYRALGEGRWVVTVTGDGSLGLARAGVEEPLALATAPPIRRYDPVEDEVGDAMGGFGPGEVLRALTAQFAPRR
jgi:hypothetical protein